MRFLRDARPALLAAAPLAGAGLTLAGGVMLLASGATPSEPMRFVWLLGHAPPLLIEVSHFLSSILGLVLVLLAFGLRSRLGAAWAATEPTLIAAAALALAKGVNWEESVALLAVALFLLPFREAFPRAARLSRMEITPGWLFSALAVLLGVWLLGWWSFIHADYGEESWWRLLADADAARAVRSSAGAGIALLAVGVWRMFASAATPPIVGEADPDFARVRTILANAEALDPSANLALLGDKRFLFSPSGESFLMFGVRGRSWIAVGCPVGRRSERLELLWRFRELADAHAARPAVYAVGPDDLPDIVELGFSIQKIGEVATTPLESFSLEGSRRGNVRRAWRKAEEDGCAFEVLGVGQAWSCMEELSRVSAEWLERHAGGEKGFSLGGFDPRYVAEFPVGLVRYQDRIVAFATLWPGSGVFSVDLMRYAEDAPRNIMDYLFVELLLWGQEQGFAAFDFGAAPLAGLDDRPLAPIMSRVGRLLFERGEEIYNFQGVRRYKDKYDPVWQPRYIAAPYKWAIPRLMADVGLLSSGGMGGLVKRPKR